MKSLVGELHSLRQEMATKVELVGLLQVGGGQVGAVQVVAVASARGVLSREIAAGVSWGFCWGFCWGLAGVSWEFSFEGSLSAGFQGFSFLQVRFQAS